MLFGQPSLVRSHRRRRLALDPLESREVPATSVTWALPSGGGDYRLYSTGLDLILEHLAGPELFRTTANATTVSIIGTADSETIDIDVSATTPSTGLHLILNAS